MRTAPFYPDKNDLLPEEQDTIGMYPHDTGCVQDSTLSCCKANSFCARLFWWSSPAHAIFTSLKIIAGLIVIIDQVWFSI
jgi:hypothetical protein